MANTGVIPIQGGGPSGPIQAAPVAEPVNIAPGLAELGHAGGEYAQALRMQDNRDAVANAHLQVSQAAVDLAQWQRDKQDTIDGDPSGYTPMVADQVSKYGQELIGQQSNPYARQYAARAFAALQRSQLDSAMQWEAGAKVKWRVDQVGQITDNYSQYMLQNPQAYDDVTQGVSAAIDDMQLPAAVKDKLKSGSDMQFRMAAGYSMNNQHARLMQSVYNKMTGVAPGDLPSNDAPSNAPAAGQTGPPSAPAAPDGSAQPGAPAAAPGGFDAAFTRILKTEGGYVANDAGAGPTNLGINQAAHPGIDVSTLTPDTARPIYKSEYWDAIGADKLPPNVAQFAFDTAVNQGPGFAKKMIAATGGDMQQMLAYRLQGYQQTAQDPAKAGNLAGWTARATNLANELQGQAPQTPTQIAQANAPTMVDVDPAIPVETLPGMQVDGNVSLSFLRGLPASKIIELKNHADTLVRKDQADAQAQLRAIWSTNADQVAHGNIPAMPDPALIARAYEPGKAAEQTAMFQTQRDMGVAAAGAGTMTIAQLDAQIEKLRPTSLDDPQWKEKQTNADTFQKARNGIVAERDKDPVQAASDQGIAKINPLNTNDPKAFALELKNRDAIAQTMRDNYGVAGSSPFTKLESDAMAENFHNLTPSAAVNFMTSMRQNLSSDVYQAGVAAFAKGAPTIQAAGNFAAKGPVAAAPDGTKASQVALTLLEGDRMLRPDKAAKQEGARVYTLPPTQGAAGMDQYIGQQVGEDFKYDPDSFARAKQGVYAYYAADSAAHGIYNEPAYDSKRLDHAIDMVIGQRSKFGTTNVGIGALSASFGGQGVLMPWGYKEDDFRRNLQQSYVNSMAAAGLTKTTVDDPSKLTPVRIDDYHYGLKLGDTTLINKQGLPIILDVNPTPASP
jgi:hypothetical protein